MAPEKAGFAGLDFNLGVEFKFQKSHPGMKMEENGNLAER
jgi:hypothetical protein